MWNLLKHPRRISNGIFIPKRVWSLEFKDILSLSKLKKSDMKYFISVIALVFCNSLYSQNYYPIVYENSGWNNVGWICDENPTPIEADLYKCYFKDDTLIDGQLYHKHYFDRTRYYFTSPYPHQALDSNIYIGAMRDNDKKYYFIPKEETVETLVYDFNLGINDTVPMGFLPYPAHRKIVFDTDTVNFWYGSQRIRYRYQVEDSLGNFLGFGSYTETLGNGRSLVHPDLYIAQYYDCGYHVYGYCEDGLLLYRSSGVGWLVADNCDFTVSINENNKYHESNILVEPNPVSGNRFSIRIGFMTEPSQTFDMKIYNQLGQIVHSEKTLFQFNTPESIEVNLQKGYYFLHLTNGNKSYSTKFIKL